VPDKPGFRLPRDDEHVAIIGRNGTGKTHFGIWMLSERSWTTKPWFVLNTKGEPIIDDMIPHTIDYDIRDRIPRQPGVYEARPLVGDKKDQETLDNFYKRLWEKQNVGVFVDEGYVSTGLKWFRAILTQGRSRRVPMIVLLQRPVWADRFIWSEASHYAAFDLNLEDDRETTGKMIPGYKSVKLPRYHSIWHDVKADLTIGLTPAPDAGTIQQRFRDLAPVKRRAI
jgi:hypothetical protein